MPRYGSSRSVAASYARAQREAARRQRELEKAAKLRQKHDLLEAARTEVEESESQFRNLVALHHTCPVQIDWSRLASVLPPTLPSALNERARRVWRSLRIGSPAAAAEPEPDLLVPAESLPGYQEFCREREATARLRALALRVLAGDEAAYMEALDEFSSLDDMAELGAEIELSVFPNGAVASYRSNDATVIPAQNK